MNKQIRTIDDLRRHSWTTAQRIWTSGKLINAKNERLDILEEAFVEWKRSAERATTSVDFVGERMATKRPQHPTCCWHASVVERELSNCVPLVRCRVVEQIVWVQKWTWLVWFCCCYCCCCVWSDRRCLGCCANACHKCRFVEKNRLSEETEVWQWCWLSGDLLEMCTRLANVKDAQALHWNGTMEWMEVDSSPLQFDDVEQCLNRSFQWCRIKKPNLTKCKWLKRKLERETRKFVVSLKIGVGRGGEEFWKIFQQNGANFSFLAALSVHFFWRLW